MINDKLKFNVNESILNLIEELPDLETYIEILRYARPAGSIHEKKMIEKIILPVVSQHDHLIDDVGNIIVKIGSSNTLFSCHTDTVHFKGGYQSIDYDDQQCRIITGSKNNDCLGADDGAGIFIMLNMIENAIPGNYIFHYGEEKGGIGSSYIADSTPDRLLGIDHAIAFDRMDYGDVITHQFGGRCCSDEFANALADLLNNQDEALMYQPDPTGSFTDTANYKDLIPECTNISVGYGSQHTSKEWSNPYHLLALMYACLEVDWQSLPVHRDPSLPDPDDHWSGYSRYFDDDKPSSYGSPVTNYAPYFLEDCQTWSEVYNYVRQRPDEITDQICQDLGIVRYR